VKHVLAITGIRSEYDLMLPVYQAIEAHPELKLSLIVSGAHLSKQYGYTVDSVKNDGFEIVDIVESLINGDRDISRLKSLAVQLMGVIQTVDRVRPDYLLVLGDREESIVFALTGAYLNIPVAHVSGGDRVVGNVDDHIRHAVSKLANLHFTTSQASADRLIKMGEQPFRVFNVGNPGIDRFRTSPQISRAELFEWYHFPQEWLDFPLLLMIQHIISSEIDDAYYQMKTTLEAITKLQLPTVISYPNSDAGSQAIIQCIEEYRGNEYIRIFENIPRLQFVNTFRHAGCLIGNSSAGFLEAPFVKLPVVNVGNRQTKRLNAGNVEFVPHKVEAIISAVKKACFDQSYREKVKACSCPFGDGYASEKIADILAKTPYDNNLFIKDITY